MVAFLKVATSVLALRAEDCSKDDAVALLQGKPLEKPTRCYRDPEGTYTLLDLCTVIPS